MSWLPARSGPSWSAMVDSRLRAQTTALLCLVGCPLSGCDECPDSRLETSWCQGSTPVRCQVNSGDGFSHNGLARGLDCAEMGLGCVIGGKHASCGFPELQCDAGSTRRFCVSTWVAACAASGHPVTQQDCAENVYGLGGFCAAGSADAICSPSPDACEADAGAQCVEGVLASCTAQVWTPIHRCGDPDVGPRDGAVGDGAAALP